MGVKVGMPMLGLKRGTASGKHAGNLRAIACEMGEERWSATKTFDPDKSDQNLHLGRYASGEEAEAAILAEVEEYEKKQKTAGGRKVREDATVAFAFIVKPQGGWINSLEPAEQERFFSDSYAVLQSFGLVSDENLVMRERHMDEGAPHEHYLCMAYDGDGKLAGSRIVNLKTFAKLNRVYPKLMQKRGWPVEILEAFDHDAVKSMTAEKASLYKAEHIAEKKRRRHGLTANEYMEQKALENAAEANGLRREIESEIADLEPKRRAAKEEVEKAEEQATEYYASMDEEQRRIQDEAVVAARLAVEDSAADTVEKIQREKRWAQREFDGLKAKDYNMAQAVFRAMGEKPDPNVKFSQIGPEFHEMLEQRADALAEQEQRVNAKARQVQEVAKEAESVLREAQAVAKQPNDKASWMLGWIKQHAPKAYAAAEDAWNKAKAHVGNLAQRTKSVIGKAAELNGQKQRDNERER